MLGELQTIYDVKNGLSEKLNKIKQGLSEEGDSDEPSEERKADSTQSPLKTTAMGIDVEQTSGMPEALMRIVETPSSFDNDSQLH